MTDIPKLNGSNWLAKGLLQVLIILALAAYIAVDKLGPNENELAPVVKETRDIVNMNSGRILRLETLMESLRSVPENMASMKATLKGVELTVDKIETKLDKRQ